MSKVFNMVGGGGKNISSIIITRLESTDTVTCTKDGESYEATWDETAQHWEIVGLPLGTFTVTATRNGKTKLETVLIDTTGVYEIEISFVLWLYRNGVEYDDTTGGWSGLVDQYYFNAFFYTNNKIDLTGMNYVGWEYLATAGDSFKPKCFVSYCDLPSDAGENIGRGDTNKGIIYADTLNSIKKIVSQNERKVNSHVVVGVQNGGSNNGTVNKNDDNLYTYIYQNNTYVYSLKLYQLVFGESEEEVKKALGVS